MSKDIKVEVPVEEVEEEVFPDPLPYLAAYGEMDEFVGPVPETDEQIKALREELHGKDKK